MAINRYILSLETYTDLDDIFEYTYLEFGINQAIKYLQEVDDLFEKLLQTPNIGRTRNEIKKDLLSIPIGKHVVFYTILDDHIRIIRVLHGVRDLPGSF